jgi:hypothetical protein
MTPADLTPAPASGAGILMDPFAGGIKQHETHSTLAVHTESPGAQFSRLDLDAIIVPASRPAEHLDHAVTLARAADCWLLILCSQQLRGSEAQKFLTARSFSKAIVIDLPSGYSHDLLRFSGLLSLQNEMPEACRYFVTDLSMKRNIGLVLARMLRWRRIFFLDDDIRDITYPDLQTTVNMLGFYSTAGLWVTDFPDNSIVCHANRMTKASQDVFVSGAALAVDCNTDIGFFPDIYNEDWFFFFDDASRGWLANSCLEATQLCYYPFANPRRAAWQEFGDVIAEGLYALLHLGLGVQRATCEYWTYFLEARRTFLQAIIDRSQSAHPDMRGEMLLSVQRALKCLQKIKPDLCERYVRLWRQDLADWKRRVAGIPTMPSIEAALTELRLAPTARTSSIERVRPLRDVTTIRFTAGPAAIPRSDTLKQLSEHVAAWGLIPGALELEKRDTKPFPVLTEEYSAAMLAAKTNGGYSPWAVVDEVGGRQRRQRLGTAMSRVRLNRRRRRGQAQPDPLPEPESYRPNGWAEPEAEATACM